MDAVGDIVGDIVDWTGSFLVHTLAPWAWEHKIWIAAALPLIVIIAVVKWMWD